jgi:gamma-glutamylcyclotransferase (GGCT)/AIG2-like uncharacterized protein YtfP
MDVFTYGSLQFPRVLAAVIGRVPPREPAVLEGFARYRVRGASYPGIVAEPGARTEGTVWRGLDLDALAALDRFEGALYERPELRVSVAPAESCAAFVYLLRPEHRALATDSAWREDDFRERHLRGYLAACRAFAQELRDDRSAP